MDPLADPAIIAEIARAWKESDADHRDIRHEEGGYIVLNPDGSHRVERWPRGKESGILPPPLDTNNRYNGEVVVATFHTHPNPPIDEIGREWEQGPSASDRRWHGRRKLRGIVVSRELVYEISATEVMTMLGKRDEVLA